MTISLRQATFDPSTRAIVAGVYLYDLPDLDAYRHFSAVAHPQVDTDYFVAFTYDTGDRFEVRRVTASTAATVSSVSVLPSVEVVSLSICTTDDADQPDGVVWAAYALEGGATYLRAWRDPAFTTYWTQQPVSISPLEKLDTVYVDSDAPSVVVSGNALIYSFDRIFYRSMLAGDGTPVHPLNLVCALGERAARAFAWRGKAYLPVVVAERDETETVTNKTGIVFHLAATDGLTPYRAPLVGSWAVDQCADFGRLAKTPLTAPAPIPLELGLYDGEAWTWAASSLVNTNQTQLDRVIIDAPRSRLPLPPTQAQGLAMLPGAVTCCFDGERVFEAGFFERPMIQAPSFSPSETGLEAGTYLYIAEWEHFDAKGNRHVSATSDAVPISPDETATVTIQAQCNFATRRGDKDDTRDAGARLVVYRTKKNESTPFYRIVSPTATSLSDINGPEYLLENDPNLDTVTLVDAFDDTSMLALGWGLYTGNLAGAIPGATQDPGPVPPSRFLLNTKGRVFGISGDDPKQIFFSRFFVPGEAPAFPPAFRIFLSDTDEAAVALGVLNDKLIIFTRTRAYYVYGDGPSDTGGGTGFSEPLLFSDALGCVEPASVCVTPMGLVFQGSADGIFLVDQGLGVTRIGGPVEDTVKSGTITSAYLDTVRQWLIFTVRSTSYTHIVYSYQTGTWARWRFDAPHAVVPSTGVRWQGKHVLGVSYPGGQGFVAAETERWADQSLNGDGEASFEPIQPRLQTPWLRVGAMTGYQRTRRFSLRGVSAFEQVTPPLTSPAELSDLVTVLVEHDEEEGGGQSFRFELATLNTLPRLDLHGHIARQKCSSVRFTINLVDKYDTRGTELYALGVELAGKQGFAKVSRQSKGAT